MRCNNPLPIISKINFLIGNFVSTIRGQTFCLKKIPALTYITLIHAIYKEFEYFLNDIYLKQPIMLT